MSRPIYMSKSSVWRTPKALFDRLDDVYQFRLDAAASDDNALCTNYFTKADDAFEHDWHPYKRVWLNPPYGRGIERWMAKAQAEAIQGCMVMCLLPVRSDSRWWHAFVEGHAHVHYLNGRLKFRRGDGDKAETHYAPFASALVTYWPDPQAGDPPRRPFGDLVARDSERRRV